MLSFLSYPLFSYFRFVVLICTRVKEIGRSYKYNRSKISTQTLKKIDLSSSAAHTSPASNLTRTYISYQLDNKDITTNQNKNNTSNIDDIHSYVTPRKQNYSVQATSTTTHLTPLKLHYILHMLSYTQQNNYPLMVKNICIFRFTVDLLMLPSVSNHGY